MGAESPAETVARLHRNKKIFDEIEVQRSRLLLARARVNQPDIWTDPDPLITVRITTFNRPRLLVDRAIASVLRQTYQNFEILVVGDHAVPETADALAAIGDPRIRYFNLPERARYPKFPRYFWSSAGALASIRSFDLCRGEWVTNLDDDDEYPPDHIEVLLHAARTMRAEFVFGVSDYQTAQGSWVQMGRFVCGQICSGAVMFSSRLLLVRPEQFSWINDEPGDWNMWRRMAESGATIGFVNHLVFRHYAEKSSAGPTAADRKRLDEQKATPQEILDDVEYAGAGRYLSLE
jgi:glycosyltransferase involved in cell wall biosynthesis